MTLRPCALRPAGHTYAEPHMYFGGVGAACRAVDGTCRPPGTRTRRLRRRQWAQAPTALTLARTPVDLGHRAAELAEPLLGVLADQPYAPARASARSGDAGLHEGVQDAALGLPQPRHHRDGEVGEGASMLAVPHGPGDLAAEAGLGLAGDLDAVLTGVGAEPVDPTSAAASPRRLVRQGADRPVISSRSTTTSSG